MPYCRNCHQEISRFDTDICPHCGTPQPIAQGYKTMDVTKAFKAENSNEYELPKTKSQKVFAILCMTLGNFGVHEFYIYRPKRGFVALGLTIFFVLAFGLPMFFTKILDNAWAFVIPFAFLWLLHILLGIYYLRVESPKDGKGEFLR